MSRSCLLLTGVLGLLAAFVADASFIAWAFGGWSPEFRTIVFILAPSLASVVLGSMSYRHPFGKVALVLGAPFIMTFICFGLPMLFLGVRYGE